MRIQVRGAGDVARSLNVRGEEIWTLLDNDESSYRVVHIPDRGYC